ncbi:MAG: hypothetical protein ACK4UT_07970, partial [Moraxellaceae bacterium]
AWPEVQATLGAKMQGDGGHRTQGVVALLLWVVNTVDAMRQEITRVGVVVAEHSRTIERHERVISAPTLRLTDRATE